MKETPHFDTGMGILGGPGMETYQKAYYQSLINDTLDSFIAQAGIRSGYLLKTVLDDSPGPSEERVTLLGNL